MAQQQDISRRNLFSLAATAAVQISGAPPATPRPRNVLFLMSDQHKPRALGIGKMHFADANSHGFEYRLDSNDWYQRLGPKAKTYADEVGKQFPGDCHPQIASLWRESGNPWAASYEKDGRKGMVHAGRVSWLDERDHFVFYESSVDIHTKSPKHMIRMNAELLDWMKS